MLRAQKADVFIKLVKLHLDMGRQLFISKLCSHGLAPQLIQQLVGTFDNRLADKRGQIAQYLAGQNAARAVVGVADVTGDGLLHRARLVLMRLGKAAGIAAGFDQFGEYLVSGHVVLLGKG